MLKTLLEPRSRQLSQFALATFLSLLCSLTALAAPAQANEVPNVAPEGFSAIGQDRQVTLSWAKVSGATGYNLWRDTGSGYVHFTTTGDTTSYVDAGLTNGFNYQYAINAVNAVGPSAQFAFASAVTVGDAQPDAKDPVPYTSIQGAQLMLYPWEGRNLVVLTASPNYDPNVMARIVATLDAAYDEYVTVTGRTPSLYFHINGKTTIAEVESTCGAGCGFLGATGIEIMPAYFNTLYSQVAANNLYDQVLFFELGRNFSFYIDQIEYKDSTLGTAITGYAVYMRFKSMEAAGAQGAPFNGRSFESFKSVVAGLVDAYEADASLNFDNTLKIGKAPPNEMSLGGPDLLASMVMRLERDFGGRDFVVKFWRQVGNQPPATTTSEALNNFVRAASAAAGTDLTSFFRNRWRWPVGTSVNHAPVAVADAVSMQRNESKVFFVASNDSDVDGDTLTITGATLPDNTHKSSSVSVENGGVRFTPKKNFKGTTTFSYTISDGKGGTATGTVTVEVQK